MSDLKSVSGGEEVGINNTLERPQQFVIQTKYVKRIAVLLAVTVSVCLVAYHSDRRVQPLHQLLGSTPFASIEATAKPDCNKTNTTKSKDMRSLDKILREAATEEKTIIITTLNRAWAQPNSTLDLFLESFHIGKGTKRLLRHLVVACVDEDAYSRCLEVHPGRCYFLKTAGFNFSDQQNYNTPDYVEMMWRRLQFLGSLLKLGYNFLFTDMDIMWLRDPFPRLYSGVDFQIACDNYNGNSSDARNPVNAGFKFVQANQRTVEFYNYWYGSRWRFRGKHEQYVFNKIKHDRYITEKLGLTMRFLDTIYFRGFCQMRGEMDKVCTMHANCCVGLYRKLLDLRQVLEDWKGYLSAAERTDGRKMMLRSPDYCWGRLKMPNKTRIS